MTQIRIATQGDCQAIAGLAIAFRNHLQRPVPTDEDFLASVTRLLDSEDAEFYVCSSEGRLLGYVLQRFRYSMWANGVEAAIEDLFVHPDARRSGFGRQLIRFALDRARARQCRSVCLDTNENNAGSRQIYASLGFNSFSTRWNGNQIFYRLPLS